MFKMEDLGSLCRSVRFLQRNTPISVKRFIDAHCSDRLGDAVAIAQAAHLLDIVKLIDREGLFDVDRPVTEESVIGGQSEEGAAACAALLRLAAALNFS